MQKFDVGCGGRDIHVGIQRRAHEARKLAGKKKRGMSQNL